MSVIGFDIGYYSCYIAVARQGGIETIANEYSDRCTPAYVAFNDKQRFIGNSAKNQVVTNLKNTVWGFKRLIARQYDDKQVQSELQHLTYNVVKQESGEVGIEVRYGGEQCVYTPLQITVMLLSKLKETAEKALDIKVVDCVISVPCFFTDVERRSMLDAASISGLNCLRLMNDTTATALAYGLYKQDLPAPEDKPRNVIFVDMGSCNFQLSACSLHKGKLKMLACAYEDVGGRDLDLLLASHFAEEFKTKYKVNAFTNKRAFTRLLAECEKMKKRMSATNSTSSLPVNIECFMDDKDVTGKLSRSQLEEMADSLLNRVDSCMKKLLSACNLAPEDIYAVEIVGGSTRVPAIKQLVLSNFGKEASTTLNADEAVARGCALQCAILSPKFMVRDFSITDCQPYAITMNWSRAAPDEETSIEVYPLFHQIPQSKVLTFYKKEPFNLEASYSAGQTIPHPNKLIGRFVVNGVQPSATGENSKVKVKVRVNLHGVFNVSSASMIEKQTTDPDGEPMDTDVPVPGADTPDAPEATEQTAAAESKSSEDQTEAPEKSASPENGTDPKAAEASTKPAASEKKKPKVKSVDLEVVSQTSSLEAARINSLQEKELQLAANDKLESERLHAKNSVEEYVYDLRDKLYGPFEQFITEQDKDEFSAILTSTEDWLYDDGEDEKKQVYMDRLSDMRKRGDPVAARAREAATRPEAFDHFAKAIIHVCKFVEKCKEGDEQYSHLSEEDIGKVEKALSEKQTWYDKQFASCMNLKKTDNPPVLTQQINSEKQALTKAVNPIMSRPKPKEEPPKEEAKPAEGDNSDTDNANTNSNASPDANDSSSTPEDSNTNPTADMDVD